MAIQLDTAKSAIKDSLYDESKPWCKFFSWAESQTGVNRVNLFIGKKFKINNYVLVICNKKSSEGVFAF